MEHISTKVYTAILFLPLLGFFVNHQTINTHAYFLIIIFALTLAYFCYRFNFQSTALNTVRKGLGCLSTSVLILLLSAEISGILIDVYKIDFCE
jgi:hypothetical protein